MKGPRGPWSTVTHKPSQMWYPESQNGPAAHSRLHAEAQKMVQPTRTYKTWGHWPRDPSSPWSPSQVQQEEEIWHSEITGKCRHSHVSLTPNTWGFIRKCRWFIRTTKIWIFFTCFIVVCKFPYPPQLIFSIIVYFLKCFPNGNEVIIIMLRFF